MLAIPIVGTVARSREVTPPEGVDTYEEFRRTMRPPLDAHVIDHESRGFFVLRGDDRSGLIAIESGPPAYVFDRSGRMVDWTSSVGGPGILGKNFRDWEMSPLPLDQVAAWFQFEMKK